MRKKITTCIIDDDGIYLMGVQKMLSFYQLCDSLMVFHNGQEALNHLTPALNNPDTLPDVILLDINMPIMDGWQFLEAFTKYKNEWGKNITIYLVSSSINPEDTERARRISGLSGYLVKPVTVAALQQLFQLQTVYN